eukprot:GILJ01002760.1.p1 GENE.GILJ01002760.1~~GILJ01002760.1.p1  ORF type:complete len:303 (+),score=34.47 GILJ01002760.1:47-955(+)
MATSSSSSAAASTLDLLLHPLVIMNISDHHTRVRTQTPAGQQVKRIIGALLGVQSGRKVEIFNSFELKYDELEGDVVLEEEFLKSRLAQYHQVFPTYEMLGWYSTGRGVQAGDIVIHKQVGAFNENPLFLLLDPEVVPGRKDLPISIYESVLHVVENTTSFNFLKVGYKIETVEAERISVDHVAKATPTDTQGSVITSHLASVHNAISMLNSRIKTLLTYLEATHKGQVPKDHPILRQVASICNRLPALDSLRFKEEYFHEYNDSLLVTYLATLTKGTNAINDLVDKFNFTYEKNTRRRAMF